MKNIYLDYAATTPVDKEVLKEMIPYFSEKFGNPSSIHNFGLEAQEAVENSRKQIALFLSSKLSEIIFTSGATESNNLAIKGIIKAAKNKKGGIKNYTPHIITSSIEHHCVLNSCKSLENEGVEVTYLKVDKNGIVNAESVKKSIKENTVLISIMYANNEIGSIEPIAEIGGIIKNINLERKNAGVEKVYFHTDAVQAANYLDCNVEKLKVDLLSLSAHKIYGPKGIGALYIKNGVNIKPVQDGGEQERNLRAGTHNVPAIVGFGKAVSIIKKHKNKSEEIKTLRDFFIGEILKNIPNSKLNGPKKNRLHNNINFSFRGVEGESLVIMLSQEGIASSTGSACSSSSLAPSHVLTAIGLSHEISHSSLRFSLGRGITKEDLEYTLEVLKKKIKKLREISGM